MANEQQEPSGFRGWLLVLAIVQVLYTLQSGLGVLALANLADAIWRLERGPLVLAITLGLGLVALGIVLGTTIAVFSRKRWFRTLFIVQWIAAVLWPTAYFALNLNELGAQQALPRLLIALIFGGPWVWYVCVSKRVKNTFVY